MGEDKTVTTSPVLLGCTFSFIFNRHPRLDVPDLERRGAGDTQSAGIRVKGQNSASGITASRDSIAV